MNIEEKYPLIDRYILGGLSEEEKTEWDSLIEDKGFYEEYIFRVQASEAAKTEGRQELKERFSALDIEKTEISSKKSSIHILFKIAAAIIVVVGIGFLIKLGNNILDTNELYVAYYEKLPNSLVVIERGESEFDSLKMAVIAYNKDEYEEALRLFEELEDENPDVAIYKAIILMEQENYDGALTLLNDISNDTESIFYVQSLYYSALCQLKMGKRQDAINLLARVTQEDSHLEKRSLELISKLR